MLHLFHEISVQGRESNINDLIMYINIIIGLSLDAYELIFYN